MCVVCMCLCVYVCVCVHVRKMESIAAGDVLQSFCTLVSGYVLYIGVLHIGVVA